MDERNMISQWLAFDTETEMLRPGCKAPPMACVSYAWEHDARASKAAQLHPSTWPAHILDHSNGLRFMRDILEDRSIGIVCHYAAFDMCVLMANDPSLVPLVFQAYRDNRVTCTKIRQQLLDIAGGKFRGAFIDGAWRKINYDLDSIARRTLGWKLEKDEWRLRYGELAPYPIEQWPEGAREYPRHDARATIGAWLAQEMHAGTPEGWLEDQFRQTRNQFWRTLISNWGLRTYPEGVEAFEREVNAKLDSVRGDLVAHGFIRPDGSRDMKAISRYMIKICAEQGRKDDGKWKLPVSPTDGAEREAKQDYETWVQRAYESGKGVALDADTCKQVQQVTEDPVITLYSDYVTFDAVKSRDIKVLVRGAVEPLHTKFDIAATGRSTSSDPNVQNVRRLPGIRECFIPRPGLVFMQADYPMLELHTLGQACIDIVGYSKLAEAINQGLDPHLLLAADIIGLEYAEAKKRSKAGDKEIKNVRQAAKVANFGYPGGLGYASFIEYARAQYGVLLDLPQAKALKQKWFGRWPEMREYFAYIGSLCDNEDGYATVKQLRSNRVRGKATYTQLCNTHFQGPGADAAGEAGFLVAEAQYDIPTSPLYGTRCVNFVHDELIGEVHPYQAHDAANELARLMMVGANRWLPDCPFTEGSIQPCLMSHWSKDAETHYHEDGTLLVWDGQDKCIHCGALHVNMWHPVTGERIVKEIEGKPSAPHVHEYKKAS